ncbi:hypothetical protein [Serinicoccus sp. CUA-874]|uniref:hypothetical protein n=1 Tax=Serinicoccus sp. CUA-874 TaxID=1517939 RepID=UPI00117AEC7C|nr:hypothetical protein [Serinicoccus sp. CUA-874]
MVAAGVGLLLALLVVLGVALDSPSLTAAAAGLLGAAILTVQVDTWRRIRTQRTMLRDEIRRAVGHGFAGDPGPARPAVRHEDVVGAVQVMQAQYTGRLDRMQRMLEDALPRSAPGRSDDGGRTSSGP